MTRLLRLTGRVLALQHKRRRKPGQEASKFKTDADTGRVIIDEDESDSDAPQSKSKPGYVEGDLYKESLTSVDGFTRGPSGKIKFHKDTKKRRREESDEDVEMADAAVDVGVSKSKKRSEVKVGQEFKAKVC
jgi:ribosomal RNA-processing protein 12